MGLAIGREPALCGLDIRGATRQPPGHEDVNPRGKSQLKRCQQRLRVQAQIDAAMKNINTYAQTSTSNGVNLLVDPASPANSGLAGG